MASDPLSRLTTRLGFFIVEDFSMLPFSAAIEPLRMANRISDQALYHWSIISEKGAPVKASNESKIDADYSINEAPGFDIVFICGGIDVEKKNHTRDSQLVSTPLQPTHNNGCNMHWKFNSCTSRAA